MPIGNGIITVDTEAQAFARARTEEQDKGGDAARAALALIALERRLAGKSGDARWRHRAADTARPTSAALRGLPPYRRFIRWTSPAPGSTKSMAEFESHWLGGEVEGAQYLPAEAAFFRDIVGGVVREQSKLDPRIDAALSRGWPLKRIEAVLRAVLRAGAYELTCRRDIPARVVTAEYVDVASAFVEARRDRDGQCRARSACSRAAHRRV